MAAIITKTDAGRREVQQRALGLSRAARTLLVLADGVRTKDELLVMVRGAEPVDVDALIAAGLVTLSGAAPPTRGTGSGERAAGSRAGAPAPAPAEPEAEPAASAEFRTPLGYQELYAALNMLCRDHLGLIKGFRYSLEIEKATGIDDLRAVAQRFVAEVEQVKGKSAGQLVRRALSIDQ